MFLIFSVFVTPRGGLYCGPLRLLALEVFESLNRQGVYTNLLTGQERREVDFSTHIACTVEMIQLNREYDVAVVDEIQMIANHQRGYAWTRALLGLRAREIHVCGGLEAYEIVQKLVESTGDEFELVSYERLSQLTVNEESLKGDYSKIMPGDCVVAFSRADIFSIRRQIERLTPYKCAVIYGQLPPETRSTQARLFNEDNTGYDVLVASDAIGMGLNLNIRRIVFHTTVKKEGKSIANWCDPSSVKQIAGRAGRLSSAYKVGEVTAWQVRYCLGLQLFHFLFILVCIHLSADSKPSIIFLLPNVLIFISLLFFSYRNHRLFLSFSLYFLALGG